jgi:hypothetical protein
MYFVKYANLADALISLILTQSVLLEMKNTSDVILYVLKSIQYK